MSQQHRILVGDCIEMMRTLPDESMHTCVTSPPYLRLRDYGMRGQIGLEDTRRSSSPAWSRSFAKCAECCAPTAPPG